MKPRTRLDYSDRIGRVLDHLHAHLDEPLDAARLAEIACFAPCHFHRVYRAMLGETPADTVRRLRLHRAALALAQGDRPVTEIARAAGYRAPEAFIRAFAAAYGAPPGAYRAHRLSPGAEGDPAMSPAPAADAVPDVHIQDRPERLLVALPHRGPYPEIGATFEKLALALAAQTPPWQGSPFVAVYHDDPSSTAPEALTSHAGVVVSDAEAAAALTAHPALSAHGAETVRLPGGPHALYVHKGPYAALESAYQRLYGGWLPQSGREPAAAPPYETYLNDPRKTPPSELLTEIALPLQP